MPSATRLRSICRPIFVFEVGWAVDLEAVERQLGAAGERQLLRPRNPSATFLQYRPAPLRIPEDAEPIAFGAFATDRVVDIVLYDLGAATVTYTIPVTGGFDDLLALSLALRDRERLRLDSRSRVEALIQRLGPAVERARVAELIEDYTVYGITSLDPPQPALGVWAANTEIIAQILRHEPSPLSPEEIHDATDLRISFGQGDMTVVDWDAALVLDPEPDDVRGVLDFANVQLLEMRYLDQQLDEALERSYSLLARRRGWRMLVPAPYRADVRAVAELQLESAVLLERVTNALKFLGEEYLTRIYRLAARRFQLPELDASITRKLTTIESIYQKMADRAAGARMEVLEWVVILLIALEVVLSLVRH